VHFYAISGNFHLISHYFWHISALNLFFDPSFAEQTPGSADHVADLFLDTRAAGPLLAPDLYSKNMRK
jgi:hypothetical protein